MAPRGASTSRRARPSAPPRGTRSPAGASNGGAARSSSPTGSRRPAVSPSLDHTRRGSSSSAGARPATRRWRRCGAEGFAGPLTLVGRDPEPPVDRPNLSKDYLAGTAPEEWIPLRGRDFYDDRRIELRLGVAAASLDSAARRVLLTDGTAVSYDALLLAPGADPIRLPLPGAGLPHVRTLRTLADSRALVAAAATAKQVVILGASFIALEVAASLRARGLAVDVVAPESVPLERVLGREVGAFVRRLHEEHGVVFHLGEKPAAIGAGAVTLESGASLAADLVVMGVGVRPATALAEGAGLAVDRGITVDPFLRTADPAIWAAGDAARFPGPDGGTLRIEHWVVAQRQGRAAARNMLGANEPFRAVPFFWSAHYDVTIAYVGHAESWDAEEVDGSLDARDARVAYLKGKKTLAVATVGRDRESLLAELGMEGDAAAP